MSYAEIPLDCTPESRQSFKLTLGADRNIHLKLTLRYLDRHDVWLAEIMDLKTGTLIISGMPLVLGINMLGQFGYKDIGEAYVIRNRPSELQHPDNKTLGSMFLLIWGDAS